MATLNSKVSLGPYTHKEKLYLETEDGISMEGLFVKFNSSKTTVLLHRVELVPSDGRIFDQYNAVLDELVCLRSLGAPNKETFQSNTKSPTAVPEKNNDLILPEIDNSEETLKKRAEQFALRKERMMAFMQSKLGVSSSDSNGTPGAESPNGNSSRDEDLDRDSSINSVQNITLKEEKEEESVSKPVHTLYETLKAKALAYIIIDKPGSQLHSAMEDIQKRSVIGLGSHGSDKGRLDRLSILSVTTDSSVYLFDIQALGKQALQAGLSTVLESPTVQKVTYDCRYLSDCLYYSHRIRMQNVYDVQAADCVMLRCRKGVFPNRGRSLQELVSQYLDLPAALLADNVNITNYKIWFQRPLHENCYNYAAWQVVFLQHLRSEISKSYEKLMSNSFDVYLNHVRKMKRGEATESLSSRRQLPVSDLNAPFSRDT